MSSAFDRLLRHPPRLWLPLLAHHLRRRSTVRLLRARDNSHSTYLPGARAPRLIARLAPLDLASIAEDVTWLAPVCYLFLDHRFDWLGLGWQQVGFESRSPGLEGHRYEAPALETDDEGRWLQGFVPDIVLADSRALWRKIEQPYVSVDWHRDHCSGFRWSASCWFGDVPLMPASGADVKQPWELARMQHLPVLALAHAFARAGQAGFDSPAVYQREFRNVVLDFAATNPPRFGVNWVCPMDVAIRIANVLLAWDLFRAHGAVFDNGFEEQLGLMALEHGRHVRGHLERRPDFAANHYLANLAGLLFIGAYLPHEPRARGWWRFAASEFRREMLRQFHPDGSNFEASVGYHQLSGEMAVYCCALILGEEGTMALPDPIPDRLAGIARFVRTIARPDGCAPPVGDLDSGRFMRLAASFEPLTAIQAQARYRHLQSRNETLFEPFYDEHLDRHLALAGACDVLLGGSGSSAQDQVLRGLARKAVLAPPASKAGTTESGTLRDFAAAVATVRGFSRHEAKRYSFDLPSQGDAQLAAFPDFGLYVVRGSGWHLTLRCGTVGQGGNGGHAHNDQLAITLTIEGEVVIEDAGSAVYEALPAQRNAYRSVRAHFAPRPAEGEPGNLDLGPFRLSPAGEGTCLWFGHAGFAGYHSGYGYKVGRIVTWHRGRLEIDDYSAGEPLVDLAGEDTWKPWVPIARKYGCPLA
jgi:hypothetical protein